MTESGSVMSKHKSVLHIIQSPSEAPNLKSNIFENMLSNEMFSIKQQLYEKNETNVSPFFITFKNNIATPTLELKQRWPIGKSLSQSKDEHKKANLNKVYITNDQRNLSSPKMDEYNKDGDNKLNDSIHSKVLGVRSFDTMPVHHILEKSNNHQSTRRHCTCMKTNPSTTCSFRCSDHTKKICTQTENYVAAISQCTRNVMPFTYYPYYIYSTLFLGAPTDSSIAYYHPDVINELKLPKHKYSKIKKPSVDLYLEDDYNKDDENEYLENQYSDEENPKNAKYPKNKHEKGKTKIPKVHFVDFKEEKPMLEADKFNDGYLQVIDRDKFVEDVVEDLKVYYSDAVIKDCYCSLSSFKFKTQNLIIYIPMLISLIMYQF